MLHSSPRVSCRLGVLIFSGVVVFLGSFSEESAIIAGVAEVMAIVGVVGGYDGLKGRSAFGSDSRAQRAPRHRAGGC
jgi:hypothetical protein